MNNNTIWALDPHTKAKHEILKRYLDRWFAILSSKRRINYIDCFAGPGRYSNGEEGSPILAIKSLINHKLFNNFNNTEFNFFFIEGKKDRCENLTKEIGNIKLPNNIKVSIKCGTFEKEIGELLNQLEEEKKILAPTFFFIDPFGFSGVPLDLIKRILRNKSCEILVNIMYEDITRFNELAFNEDRLTSLFGTTQWKQILRDKSLTPPKKLELLKELYDEQLRNYANAEYTLSFLMINKFNKPDYFLFFGTNSDTGFEKMKEAMYIRDPTGEFKFSDFNYDPKQRFLFDLEPNYKILQDSLLKEFEGKMVSIDEIEIFVRRKTLFIKKHIRNGAIFPLLKSNKIQLINKNKIPKGTCPSGTIIKFN